MHIIDIVNQLLEKNQAVMTEGYVLACMTDTFESEGYGETQNMTLEQVLAKLDESKLLELRIFNEKAEIRLVRGDIGQKEFRKRYRNDEQQKENEYIDEDDFLDFDSEKGQDTEGYVYTTGGGRYKLPITVGKHSDVKIKVRNYIAYNEDSNQAYVKDWRFVGFVEGGRSNGTR